MKKNVAIVGATGAVGRKMIGELEELGPDFSEVSLFASPRSAGQKIKFKGKDITVEEFSSNSISDSFVLMSAGGSFSREYSQALVENNCVVIDNSSAWRMEQSTPLVVPEVNAGALDSIRKTGNGIVANPNCSTIQLAVSLKPLQDAFGIDELHVSTYQSVSGAGQKGIADLEKQISNPSSPAEALPRRIFCDLIPAIDVLDENSHCFEEIKMVNESRKILADQHLPVFVTTVRVPTRYGHGESVHVRLKKKPQSIEEVLEVLRSAKGLEVSTGNDYAQLQTPKGVENSRSVHVDRVRFPVGMTSSNLVQYWNVSNNLLKGAATNAVQILNELTKAS